MVSRTALVQWFACVAAALAQRDIHGSGTRYVPISYFSKLTLPDQPSSQIKFSEDYNTIGITNNTPDIKVVSHNCSDSECKLLIDLGKNFYPRYLQEVLCRAPATPKFYTFKVLTKRGNSRADIDIPESLRSCWKFMEVKVPVACDCPFKL
ncbi:uncharacterized protein [Rhodnius prolixus]|uniref:uncharacterized protein n=1 Tax=Rhodnius prolixus TaxID=13249 RepID=UPI003D18A94A